MRNGRLYVWSPNTVLPVSAVGDPHGVTRTEALVLLRHGGDVVAAARELRVMGVSA